MSILAIVFDITGTLRWANNTPVPGAADALHALRAKGYALRCLTNNPRQSPAEVARELDALGFGFVEGDVLTANSVTVEYLVEHHRDQRILVVEMSPLMSQQLTQRGLDLTSDRAPEVVLLALSGMGSAPDPKLMALALDAIQGGAVFLATSGDPWIPWAPEDSSIGQPRTFLVTAGTFLELIEGITGRRAQIVGKPDPWAAHAMLKALGLPGEQVLMVGDHLTSDIRFAQQHLGAQTALVLTGLVPPSQRALVERLPDPPTYIVDSVTELVELL
jgi:HAD superfamily hydrolase (TIGR01450 family)